MWKLQTAPSSLRVRLTLHASLSSIWSTYMYGPSRIGINSHVDGEARLRQVKICLCWGYVPTLCSLKLRLSIYTAIFSHVMSCCFPAAGIFPCCRKDAGSTESLWQGERQQLMGLPAPCCWSPSPLRWKAPAAEKGSGSIPRYQCFPLTCDTAGFSRQCAATHTLHTTNTGVRCRYCLRLAAMLANTFFKKDTS